MTGFRFGAVAALQGPASLWAQAARALEDAGYSTLLVPDTLRTISPFPALAAAAAATTVLHVGTWVVSAPLRSPAALVRETRALQELSTGRLELGVGAGRPGGEGDAEVLGVPWGRPGVRVGQVEAALTAARGVEPMPRLVVAAAGERMLTIAGRLADTIALPAGPMSGPDEVSALAARARMLAGEGKELSVQIAGLGDDVPAGLRGRPGMSAESMRERRVPTLLSGDPARDADALAVLRERTGISYITVPHEFAARVAPLVKLLTGR